MRILLPSVLVATLLLGACKKDIQTEDAVRQGILNYLSKRSDLSSMDVTVTKVAFRQNEADATVHFQAKNSNAPGTGLDMGYVLERKGSEWVVKGRAAGMGHGGAMGGAENPHGPVWCARNANPQSDAAVRRAAAGSSSGSSGAK